MQGLTGRGTLARSGRTAARTAAVKPRNAGRRLTSARFGPQLAAEQAAIIRAAHFALEASYRGKGGIHTVTDARKVLREVLDVVGDLTGIRSSVDTLPFEGPGGAA